MSSEYKNPDYLNTIREKPCLMCQVSGNSTGLASEAHHEDVLESNRYAKRSSDYSAVPLCKLHHEQRHAVGFEVFWRAVGDYLGEQEAEPFFVAASIVVLYLLDFLEKITGDLDEQGKEPIISAIADILNNVFNVPGKASEEKLRESLETVAKIVHEQYIMRYRQEVN